MAKEIEITVRAEDQVAIVKIGVWFVEKIAEFKYGRGDNLTREEWEDVNNFVAELKAYRI